MMIYSMQSRIHGILHGHIYNIYEYLLMIKHVFYIELTLQNYLIPTFYILIVWLRTPPLSQCYIEYNLLNIHSNHLKKCSHFNVYGALFIMVVFVIMWAIFYVYQMFYFISLIENQSIIKLNSRTIVFLCLHILSS